MHDLGRTHHMHDRDDLVAEQVLYLALSVCDFILSG